MNAPTQAHNGSMELGYVMQALHDSGINCHVSTSSEGRFEAKLGDAVHGWLAEAKYLTATEAAVFLDRAARNHFPESLYSLGREEMARRGKKGRKIHLVKEAPRE